MTGNQPPICCHGLVLTKRCICWGRAGTPAVPVGEGFMDSTQRFTSRVENYVKYRPHYPERVLEILREECGLTPDWVVADIGSGTGISSELFLHHGNRVYGVEPNAAMRGAAEAQFAGDPRFVSIDGTAEATTLPDSGIDLIIAGQAFHWFDREKARTEFRRILKPGGWVALFWNERRAGGTPFLDAYEQLLRDYASDYGKVSHRNITDAELTAFFSPGGYRVSNCEYAQWFDFQGVAGRLLSSSYAPEPGHPNHEPMMQVLKRIVADYAQDGKVCVSYDTKVYYGRLTG